MIHIGLFHAKSRLSALIDEVERGGEITITRCGKAVAKLVPIDPVDKAQAAVVRLRALRESIAARGESMPWSELKAYRRG